MIQHHNRKLDTANVFFLGDHYLTRTTIMHFVSSPITSAWQHLQILGILILSLFISFWLLKIASLVMKSWYLIGFECTMMLESKNKNRNKNKRQKQDWIVMIYEKRLPHGLWVLKIENDGNKLKWPTKKKSQQLVNCICIGNFEFCEKNFKFSM